MSSTLLSSKAVWNYNQNIRKIKRLKKGNQKSCMDTYKIISYMSKKPNKKINVYRIDAQWSEEYSKKSAFIN